MAAPRCQAMNPQCHSSRAFLCKLVFSPLCPPHLVCGHANEDKQSLASSRESLAPQPQRIWAEQGVLGLLSRTGTMLSGQDFGWGKLLVPNRASWR